MQSKIYAVLVLLIGILLLLPLIGVVALGTISSGVTGWVIPIAIIIIGIVGLSKA